MKSAGREEDNSAAEHEHGEKSARTPSGPEEQENCRCKEVSKKSIPELLKVVIGDLSFWKKK